MKRKAEQKKTKDVSKKRSARNNHVHNTEASIDIFPAEIKVLIFSFLGIKELTTTQLVCNHWKNLSQDSLLWRDKVQRHFSYLLLTQEEISNPFELYRAEYLRLQKLIELNKYHFGMQQLLEVLSGNLSPIESDENLDPNDKTFLYSHALANGHFQVLQYLDDENTIRVLEYSAQIGNLSVVKYLIENNRDILPISKGSALVKTADNGYLAITQYILENNKDILPIFIGETLNNAAKNGHLPIVQYLLEQNQDILLFYKGEALKNAATNGHLLIVQCLLKQTQNISTFSKEQALCAAAANGHLSIVQYLLEQDQNISSYIKTCTLTEAVNNGHLPIVQYLLAYAHDIDKKDKEKAILLAKDKHPEIAECIQNSIKSYCCVM